MKMKSSSFLLSAALIGLCSLKEASGDVVLSKGIMKLAVHAAELSALAYEENPPTDEKIYDYFGFFDEEPDQAIVARRHGYCFGAFRGTTLTWSDWQQNFDLGYEDVCTKEPDGLENCCSTREGFYKAYFTHYRKKFESSLRTCAKDCKNIDECVVLTGHSQGGAIASVAGLQLADLNPYVITFGQPATIDAPCSMITSERWFRFVNTKESDVGIAYDPVPFVPGMGADSFGHMIMLGEDPTGIAYIGLDAQDKFGPLNTLGFESHSMKAAEDVKFPGYLDRLKTLMHNETYPVRANGFASGSLCSEDKECMSGKCGKETSFSYNRCIGIECDSDDSCASGRCDSGACVPKLGSCMACDEDSDCAGGKCLLFRCSGESGLMDNNCRCKRNSDCASGRCEIFSKSKSIYCEARLGVGARCNEASDCISNYCSWKFRCEDKERSDELAAEEEKQEHADKEKNGNWFRNFAIIVIVLAATYIGMQWYYKQAAGYVEIPTSMNV